MEKIVFFIAITLNSGLACFFASKGNIAKTILHSTFVLSLVLLGLFAK